MRINHNRLLARGGDGDPRSAMLVLNAAWHPHVMAPVVDRGSDAVRVQRLADFINAADCGRSDGSPSRTLALPPTRRPECSKAG